ncbi:MAG: penicillin-binding protein 2 [Alphaproteobacteria bacterium]
MNRKEQDSAKVFTRRAFVIGGIQGALLAVMGGRLAWLQIAEGRKYKMLADRNRINIKLLAPSRGEILDRYGVAMAGNSQNFRVVITPEHTKDIKTSLLSLQNHIEMDEREVQRAIEAASRVAKFVPVQVKDDLSWEEVAKIEVNLPDLPGLSIDVGERRDYLFADSTAHLIGYVGAVSESEIGEDRLLRLPGFRIGKSGIERRYESILRGSAGTSKMEVNVVGREVRELARDNPKDGSPVILSVDSGLQHFTQERLNQEQSASAVIMDAKTGAVYALASSPGFDPNIFTKGLPASVWEELTSDPRNPLSNKAVAGQYPPGSTYKMVTALAGLESGAIKPHTRVFCPGHYDFGDNRFHCWKKGGHGSVDLVKAISESCDVFFYRVALEFGIDKLAETSRRMGLGARLDFDLPEERPGLIPDRDWKRGYFGTSWQPGETIVASIGQGYTLTTPLQLAVMTARFVNGGHAVKPWLYNYQNGMQRMEDTAWPSMNLDPEHLRIIKRGMDDVVNGPTGTARGSQIRHEGMRMGGKTGTAQVVRITAAQRAAGIQNRDLPWRQRHHALFVGYAPIDNPRYVASVVVEHGVSGSGSAAPLARDLLIETQRRNPASSKIITPDQLYSGRKPVHTVRLPPSMAALGQDDDKNEN